MRPLPHPRRRRRAVPRRQRERTEREEEVVDTNPPPEESLAGLVLRVPDGWWGFSALGRVEHPGVCSGVDAARDACLLKGTSRPIEELPPWVAAQSFVVAPSPRNGLTKTTSFHLAPHRKSARAVRLLLPQRKLGTLEEHDLRALQARLARALGGKRSFHA